LIIDVIFRLIFYAAYADILPIVFAALATMIFTPFRRYFVFRFFLSALISLMPCY